MGLLKNLFQKKKTVITNDNNHNSLGNNLDELVDGELPLGWEYAKKDFIGPRDDMLYELSHKALKAQTIDEEILLLEKVINYYNNYKKECMSLGVCYYKYFSDMHMHCHNSRDKDFEFIKNHVERLEYIKANYERLIEEEKVSVENNAKKQHLMIDIDKRLYSLIEAHPGILQSDLYKEFDLLIKEEIGTILYEWARSGKITREKCGRSYKLYLN